VPEKFTSEEETLESVEALLENATKIRLRSDVPIGAFLSGGLDSSLVCAIMKKKFNYAPETFTIGFEETEFDESVYAKQLANYLNLKNDVVYMSSDAVCNWPKVTWYNDQPHGDISFIPTFMVSEAAAKKYKVVFSGDGGDEAFGGYLKYLSLIDEQKVGESYFSGISLLNEFKTDYRMFLSDSFLSKVEIGSSYQLFQKQIEKFDKKDVINQGILFDVKNLLPGNNLVKPDRMAMANSLEVRSPLLDYRIYELMFDLPGNLKISKELGTKHLLKKLSLKYLPENLVYRKKQMFTVPVGEWFKTNLNNFLTNNLLDSNFIALDIFKEAALRKMIEEHTSGIKNYTRELRAVLNLKLWFDQFMIGDK
jgi:asparagine synthase (glutamine-hydrolysing)